MSAQRLLFDAGNTSLKWAVLEAGRWRRQGRADYSDLSALAQVMQQGANCYIASVAGEQQENQLNTLLATFSIEPKWLRAGAQFLDVKNSYASPPQLGVDRWMGLIAARQRTQSATLVVSVGTAMTVDALSAAGVFLGGVIVPGFAMMKQALRQGTARVAEGDGIWQAFPRNTADAVESFLTGGDADKLMPHLNMTMEYVPSLVLEGIARVAQEDEKA
jgi:type III pantothenate kinase